MNFTDAEEYLENCYLAGETFTVITRFPENKKINQIVGASICILDGLLIVPTVLLNLVAARTILKSPKLKEKICFFLIFVQSLFDTAVGAISLPLFTIGLGMALVEKSNCLLNLMLLKVVVLFTNCSFHTLAAMTFERYMGIFHPFAHRTKVTKNTLLKYILGACVVTIGLLFLSAISPPIFLIVYAVMILFFIVFATFVYARVFFLLSKRIRSRKRAMDGTAVQSPSDRKHERQFQQQTRQAKSCFLVLVCHMVCFLPSCFVYFLSEKDRFLVSNVFSLIMTLLFLNSILNSIIFFWRNPVLIRQVTSTFSCRSVQ